MFAGARTDPAHPLERPSAVSEKLRQRVVLVETGGLFSGDVIPRCFRCRYKDIDAADNHIHNIYIYTHIHM